MHPLRLEATQVYTPNRCRNSLTAELSDGFSQRIQRDKAAGVDGSNHKFRSLL